MSLTVVYLSNLYDRKRKKKEKKKEKEKTEIKKREISKGGRLR